MFVHAQSVYAHSADDFPDMYALSPRRAGFEFGHA